MKPVFIDHIVLMVKDVESTAQFYGSFLDEPITKSEEQVAYKVGETTIFFGLPYKEYKPHDKDVYGLNHLTFRVSSLEELKEFENKLSQADIKHSGIQIDKYGGKEFIWFDDPDGYRLEFYLR
jgi:catechol-2,3-dioxygenase